MPKEQSAFSGAQLRWLLVLVILLAVTPVFVLHLVRLQSGSEEALQQAHEQAVSLAQSGADAHRQIAVRARNFLEVLSQVPVVRRAELPECENFLRRMLDGRDWLLGVFVVAPSGKGVCGADPVVRTLDVSDRAYFQDAVTGGTFVLSEVIMGRVSHQPLVAAVLPVHTPDGRLETIIGTTLGLNWINEVALRAQAENGILIALDRNSSVVAYQSDSNASASGWTIGEKNDSPLAQTIMDPARSTSTFVAADPEGIRRIFGVARLPDLGLTVAVGIDRLEVLKATDRRFQTDLLFLLLVAAASIGAALALAEFGLLRGVNALKRAAQRLKAGKMGLRVKLPGFVAAELHDLAATYNAMTAEFERLAYLDRLTGLPNRRYLERYLAQREKDGAASAAARQAVLAIDLDGFKPVNDHYGHAVGDKVLTIIARRIAAVIDERGLLFRVGGDEFVALLPLTQDQEREHARALAEEIRQAMEHAIEYDEMTFPVACSIGVAMVPDDAHGLASAIVVADVALYEAKRSGRNRVIGKAPPMVPEPATDTAMDISSGVRPRHWAGQEPDAR